jgi:hypothetical protein
MSELDIKIKERLKKIPDLVWEELKKDGYTIFELERKFEKQFIVDKEQKSNRNDKKWHKKEIFDKILEQKLDLKSNDFPSDKSGNNTFSKTIAKTISNLRNKGKIIDAKFGYPRYGIWRRTTPEEEKSILEFKKGDYSWPEHDIIAQKIKKREFTNTILKNYERKCCICQFKDQENLSAAHILPLDIMRDVEPENVLNPSNGILLCGICENAFDKKILKISEEGEVIKTTEFHQLNEYHLEYWKEKINNITKISFPKKNFPGKKFLNLKQKLN